MRRKYKPFLQTDDSIKEIITIIVATVVTPRITVTRRNYITLYIIGKDIAYKKYTKEE